MVAYPVNRGYSLLGIAFNSITRKSRGAVIVGAVPPAVIHFYPWTDWISPALYLTLTLAVLFLILVCHLVIILKPHRLFFRIQLVLCALNVLFVLYYVMARN